MAVSMLLGLLLMNTHSKHEERGEGKEEDLEREAEEREARR